jgi:RNA polymerase sigma-70 factor, ECF subfamily
MLTLSHGNAVIDDVCQETFVRAFSKLADFDFNGPAKLSTWLRKIALRVALNHRRRNLVELPLHNEPTQTHDYCEWKVHQTEMVEAIMGLPADQRAILHLRYWEELEYHEIASVLHVKVGTVKSRLSRARNELRRRFDAPGPTSDVPTRMSNLGNQSSSSSVKSVALASGARDGTKPLIAAHVARARAVSRTT